MPIDVDLLDDEDPFEIDGENRPHLFKHPPFGVEDLYDVYFADPVFAEAKAGGSAELLMIGPVPGHGFLTVPLAPPRSGEQDKVRPIGIYSAGLAEIDVYRETSFDQLKR